MHDYAATIIKMLETFRNADRAKKAESYSPTKLEVLGATNPQLKELTRSLKKEYSGFAPADWVELARQLTATDTFECHLLAFMLLEKQKRSLLLLNYDDIFAMSGGLDNWVLVDTISCYITGYIWRHGKLTDQQLQEWAVDDNRWIRRMAVVSTVGLNQKSRGGTGDPDRTLMICEMVVDDHDDMIVKALSWALRELSKSYPDPVEDFLVAHESQLARRVVREVRRKLETGKKN